MKARTDYLGRDGYTWWVGEVESVKDPSQLGRVKVRILGWYTGHKEKEAYQKVIPTEILPWANVLLPTDKPQTKNTGTTTELQPGAWVLGFFLDGEEAQLPIVMGAFRGFQEREADKKTTTADGTEARELDTASPQKKDLTNQERNDGASFTKAQASQPASPGGSVEESRGVISAAEQALPGNAVTNPIKPPVEKQAIGDGVAGPGGEGFLADLERMLTELGNMASSVASGPGGFVAVATGNKLAGDKVKEHLGKICNALSSGIAGILAPLKEMLAKVIAEVVGKVVQAISQFIPLGVINMILSFIEEIFNIFCAKTPMWLGLVQSAISDTVNFANRIASLAINKVQGFIDQSGIGKAVKGVTDRILNGITSAMNRVRDVAQDVIAAVNTAKQLASKARQLGETVQMIFQFDFTSLDWGSLIAILKAILGTFFKKDCGRKIKRPKSKSWFPLIGSTSCTNIADAVKGTPYDSSGDIIGQNFTTGGGGQGGKGSYIDKLFADMSPYLTEAQTFLNGAKIINDATPGKEKKIVSGPGGVSSFEDAYGNRHTNVPNNETKIIAKDKCETIKGNYCLTVEGDFYLKVMGNFHEEVTGAKNEHSSNGPQSESDGSTKAPDKAKAQDNTRNTANTDTNVIGNATSSDTFQKNRDKLQLAKNERYTILKRNNVGGFYPVDEIPYLDDADHMGRTPTGPQLSGTLKDDNEQKSAARKEGDHEISYTGELKLQGSKVKITGVEAVNINAQTVKTEANTIEMQSDGEIIQEANWITSFLNAGRFEFIGVFNPFSAITGRFSLVKGTILDVATDTPSLGGSLTPPTCTRIAVGTTQPASINDITTGSNVGIHNTFVAAPTGTITEFVPNGTLVNQVVTGMISNTVGAGYCATGATFGPHQVFGLPLLLN